MSTIYLSSTYEDLKDYRRTIYEALRQSDYEVKAMEDYVASDRRPVDQCLRDVEQAVIYVGLFGFRYGYVPSTDHGNPEGRSITELELRHAKNRGIPCLIFIAKEEADIPLKFVDAYSGDGEKGAHIKRLRQELLTQYLTKSFSTPHELSSLVLSSVKKQQDETNHQERLGGQSAGSSSPITWDIEKYDSPYPGLLHFTRKYAPVFFGREAEVREILDRLRGPEGRFMIISGDSGVGKSSVVDAGLLPVLESGGLPDQVSGTCVRMVPSQRQQPVEAFLAALGSVITQAGLRPDTLLTDLTRAPETLGAQITTIMKKSGPTHELVLFIDQMEELFTAHDLTQTNRFLSALYRAAQERALWVIGTIRSDHLQHCHRHPDLLKVMNGNGRYALGPVKPHMMEDMIRKPAQAAGLTITESFARRLIHDTADSVGESTSLPMLAFVLDQLFQRRKDRELSESAYNELGEVAGAIAAHAKTVEATIKRTLGMKLEEGLAAIFQTLVKIHKEEGIPTRNRPLKAGFTGNLSRVVDLLISERLLRTEGEGEEATVSISHEKLFESWPALKDYVETHKKVLLDRTLLESRAQKWAAMGKPWFSGLATGREYHDFQQAGLSSTSLTKEFLQASRQARLLWMVGGLVVLLLLGGVTWLWQKGYNMEQAGLKVQSLVVSIHVQPKMVSVPGGTFQQGDVEGLGEAWRNPVREVTVPPFAMGKHEVTFHEYDRFAIATNRKLPEDQGWGRDKRPVINVSWDDANLYATWLSEKTGKRYRLPTESESEYAARSGNKQEPWAGTSEESELGNYAVYSENSGNKTAEVGSKQANDFKLKDMSGNVYEWVEDCAHGTYERAPTDGSAWLEGENGDCSLRVIRGGSWIHGPETLRSSYRGRFNPDVRIYSIGFRLAQGTP